MPDLKKHGVTAFGNCAGKYVDGGIQSSRGCRHRKTQSLPPHPSRPDPLQDTSLRKFKRGTVLRYGIEIYNPKLAVAWHRPKIRIQARVFHDRRARLFRVRKRRLDRPNRAKPSPFIQTPSQLGENLLPGDYVLQIVVTDGLAKDKNRIATQYVQFEVVE